RFAALLQLSVKQSSFLWKWINDMQYNYYIGIVVACIVDSEPSGLFFYPRVKSNDPNDSPEPNWDDHFTSDNDLKTCLNVWGLFTNQVGLEVLNKKKVKRGTINKWALTYSINAKKLVELIHVIRSTISSVGKFFNGRVQVEHFDVAEASDKALPILAEVNASMRMIKDRKKGQYFHPSSNQIYTVIKRGIPSSGEFPQNIVALVVITSDSVKSKFNVHKISMFIPDAFVNQPYSIPPIINRVLPVRFALPSIL